MIKPFSLSSSRDPLGLTIKQFIITKILIMKATLVVLAALAVGALAGNTAYGPPPQEEQHVPQTFRHVYVHQSPDEPTEVQNRVIRVPGGDKHVNIIFVKTPSQSSQSQTEVILPEQDEHKNLVYVLLKKGENQNDVRIRRPAAPRQQKPEVYFIRYKGQEQEQGGYQQAPPAAAPVRTPSTQYGF
ncbi:hypothetical protein Ocin01_05551 [Orchesella cincta]|uniref:DUF243 domain-containing protein n=1 Tax=Orchesella cincta TaxID=48709 RepID=A0A1D2N7R6_ORCCI|nr:hypothetical protein Ocin01_05551 [Orchesella cincta]